MTQTQAGDPALAERLKREIRGDVLFDAAARGRYSTDASIYQIEPIGVVVPATEEDALTAFRIALDAGVPARVGPVPEPSLLARLARRGDDVVQSGGGRLGRKVFGGQVVPDLLDIDLKLHYNSRLWSKAGSEITYDSDSGYPAPGWNLGFGKMFYMGQYGGCSRQSGPW